MKLVLLFFVIVVAVLAATIWIGSMLPKTRWRVLRSLVKTKQWLRSRGSAIKAIVIQHKWYAIAVVVITYFTTVWIWPLVKSVCATSYRFVTGLDQQIYIGFGYLVAIAVIHIILRQTKKEWVAKFYFALGWTVFIGVLNIWGWQMDSDWWWSFHDARGNRWFFWLVNAMAAIAMWLWVNQEDSKLKGLGKLFSTLALLMFMTSAWVNPRMVFTLTPGEWSRPVNIRKYAIHTYPADVPVDYMVNSDPGHIVNIGPTSRRDPPPEAETVQLRAQTKITYVLRR